MAAGECYSVFDTHLGFVYNSNMFKSFEGNIIVKCGKKISGFGDRSLGLNIQQTSTLTLQTHTHSEASYSSCFMSPRWCS